MKVVALTSGTNVPSARFRITQHLSSLMGKGIDVLEIPAKHNSTPPKEKRLIWFILALVDNIIRTIKSRQYDLVIVQKPMISTLYSSESLIRGKYIFDVDDAVHLNSRLSSVDYIAKNSLAIICGNDYLRGYYLKFNKPVYVVPTAVDHNYYTPKCSSDDNNDFVIGWSGTSGGFKFLYEIESSLKIIIDKYPHVKIKIVSNEEPCFSKIEKSKVIFEKWSKDLEVTQLHSFDVGIMPLANDNWSLGKCSYKMLTYMSVGIPVVVSNFGMNKEILEMGTIGFGANTENEWVDSLDSVINMSVIQRRSLGSNGRIVVMENFSQEIISNKLVEIYRHHCEK